MFASTKTSYLPFTSCQSCNHGVHVRIKICLFYAMKHHGTLAALASCTLQPELLFLPYLSFNKSNYSIIELRLTFSGSQLQDTI